MSRKRSYPAAKPSSNRKSTPQKGKRWDSSAGATDTLNHRLRLEDDYGSMLYKKVEESSEQ